MAKKNLQKLELTWIGKGEEPKLEPRILIEQPEYSYGDLDTGNMLIHGDNLLALKALEQEYSSKVDCIYIDPPYNTGSAFEHYEDGLEHSTWLNLIYVRIKILKKLLTGSGSIWISIDDTEYPYLKVILDEIFGRDNFVTTIIWEKRKTRENRRSFSFKHDYVICYAQNKKSFESKMNKLPLNEEVLSRYRNPDGDIRGKWQSISAMAQAGHGTSSQFYELIAPNGKVHKLPKGNCWRYNEDRMKEAIEDNRIWFGKTGNNVPRIKKYLNESDLNGLTPETIWYADEVGTNDSAKKHSLELFTSQKVFDTPKPEELIERIVHISTSENDLILDSFIGSGTTAAVAHKMGRRYIGVELGDHAYSHCVPRLIKVIKGEKGGVSKKVNWQGGGGFKFYTLAPSLLQKDKYGNWVIDQQYNADMLAAAMSKQEGFLYQPDSSKYWKQGQSTERDFIYTTTQFVTVETLDKINEEMQDDETLLICCKAFSSACKSRYSNITIKKIPHILLGRCEFGKDDYSLNIIDMPFDRDEDEGIDFSDDTTIQEINLKERQTPSIKTLFD